MPVSSVEKIGHCVLTTCVVGNEPSVYVYEGNAAHWPIIYCPPVGSDQTAGYGRRVDIVEWNLQLGRRRLVRVDHSIMVVYEGYRQSVKYRHESYWNGVLDSWSTLEGWFGQDAIGDQMITVKFGLDIRSGIVVESSRVGPFPFVDVVCQATAAALVASGDLYTEGVDLKAAPDEVLRVVSILGNPVRVKDMGKFLGVVGMVRGKKNGRFDLARVMEWRDKAAALGVKEAAAVRFECDIWLGAASLGGN